MVCCSRFLEFDAAHRVYQHEGKCKHVHGHRYKVEIKAKAKDLDSLGRVIDFSVIKEKVGGWIDENWDHNALIYDVDPLGRVLEKMSEKPIFYMPTNPTAENIAKFLLDICNYKLLIGTGVEVVKVVVWETPNCKAEATLHG